MTAHMTALTPRTLILDHLTARRGERELFVDLDLKLSPGEAAELRGPNGIGKTTLLLIAAGIVRPAAGTMRLEDGDPEARWETDIGYLGHRPAIKPRLTVAENLTFWAKLGGAPAAVQPALETVGLAPIAWLEAGNLSAGQTRRLALARLLVGERPVWLMDEPTAALDTAGEALVARLVDAHLDAGGSALIATHHDLGLAHATRTIRLGQPVVAA
jgi:heme exporter protein A